jgi:hypothetical protein
MLYALASIRAYQFSTTGLPGDEDLEEAFVNAQVIREFNNTQNFLMSTDENRCEDAEDSVDRITALMKIPMIQSIFRYAYIRDIELPHGETDRESVKAEGATFAATMLPYIHYCSAIDASLIHKHMRVGESDDTIDFEIVKAALERNYNCMGVTCEEVGGIWDDRYQNYKPGAQPCNGTNTQNIATSTSDTGANAFSPIRAMLGTSFGILFMG